MIRLSLLLQTYTFLRVCLSSYRKNLVLKSILFVGSLCMSLYSSTAHTTPCPCMENLFKLSGYILIIFSNDNFLFSHSHLFPWISFWECTTLNFENVLSHLLKSGYIEESFSPYASPILFVPKKDGTLRFCIDYR